MPTMYNSKIVCMQTAWHGFTSRRPRFQCALRPTLADRICEAWDVALRVRYITQYDITSYSGQAIRLFQFDGGYRFISAPAGRFHNSTLCEVFLLGAYTQYNVMLTMGV